MDLKVNIDTIRNLKPLTGEARDHLRKADDIALRWSQDPGVLKKHSGYLGNKVYPKAKIKRSKLLLIQDIRAREKCTLVTAALATEIMCSLVLGRELLINKGGSHERR